MNYIFKIFDRANIQSITDYLLYGHGTIKVNERSYEERLDKQGNSAIAMIDSKFPDFKERETIKEKIYDYVDEVKDVYMEVGMQCGAFIVFQLLRNFNDSKD